jgi:hypothetical protein
MSSDSNSRYPWKKVLVMSLLMVTLSGCVSRRQAREDYLDWSIRSICNAFEDVILNTSCKTLIFFQGDNIKRFIDFNTTETSLIVYTVYKTSLLGYEVETISVFGNHKVISVKSY